ncbi:MAG TPA: Fe-S cluster assembly ATPase SufC [Acidimicrobiia bacterium]|nr:Fe-S cluster assembly ATPase SufC [Acidimicrobiia bacterium]
MTSALAVRDLHARRGAVEILHGVDLDIPVGELHVLMGPNGSGKSTLCHAVMGRPNYEISGSALVGGTEVLGLPTDERARLGLFEAFQYPVDIGGVTLRELLTEMELAGAADALARGEEAARVLGMEAFLDRRVNGNLSGGEKKKSEIVQLLALAPTAAILDEIDSGLDVDAVRDVAEAVDTMRGPGLGVLLITHYTRIMRYLDVDAVHVMMAGRIVRSGGRELADEMDAKGYEGLRRELGLETPLEQDPFP